MNECPRISVVIPCYNEEETVQLLIDSCRSALEEKELTYELIFVDDGSTDQSVARIEEAAAGDERVKLIQFRRNFGQTAAVQAGIDHSSGEIIVPIDADLQNDPGDIPLLVEELEKGWDIVSGWRKDRQDEAKRTFVSKVANQLIAWVTGVRLNDYGCTLKAYRAEVIKSVELVGEMHRFIPAICSWQGASLTEMVVRHHPRKFGETKYGMNRIFKVILDLMTVKFFGSYLSKPGYFFGGAGFFAFALTGIIWVFQAARVFFMEGAWISPLLFIGLLMLMVGIQFMFFGVLAEVIIRIYYRSGSHRSYAVKKRLNVDSPLDGG